MKGPWFPIMIWLVVPLAIGLGIIALLPAGGADWINKWQTLISAIIAVGAAALVYRSADAQLRQNKEQEQNRRSRKHAALRAMLPLALSHIAEYAQNSAHGLIALIRHCHNGIFPQNGPINNLPQPLPHDTLEVLAEFIEYSDEIDATLVEAMVVWIQVHNTNVRTFIRDNQNPQSTVVQNATGIEGFIIEAASIFAAAEALLGYGRRTQRKPPRPSDITWKKVRDAFKIMRIWEQNHPKLYKNVEDREKRSNGPFDRLAN